MRYGSNENYERLVPFGCKVDRYIQKSNRGKLDDVSSPGIMVGYDENSTETFVLDFNTRDIVKAPSTSRYHIKNFPGIPEEVLASFILKYEPHAVSELEAVKKESYNSILGRNNKSDLRDHEISEIPNNICEARNTADSKLWISAVNEELKTMKRFDAFEEVDIPLNQQVVTTRFVFTKKFSSKTNTTRHKARLVIRGFELKCNYGETFAPTPQLDSLRFVVSYCASKSREEYSLFSIDFVSAFLNAINDPEMYVSPPLGVEIGKGKCWKLKKALYGSTRAPRLWHKTLEKFLRTIRFEKTVADPCLYYRKDKNNSTGVIFFYVDYPIICSNLKKATEIIGRIREKFEIHELGYSKEILAIQIRTSKAGIHLSTMKTERVIIADYEMESSKPANTPLPPGLKLPHLRYVENVVEIPKI